jgi:hypothetical protein
VDDDLTWTFNDRRAAHKRGFALSFNWNEDIFVLIKPNGHFYDSPGAAAYVQTLAESGCKVAQKAFRIWTVRQIKRVRR